MKLKFTIAYRTRWGQNLYVCGNLPELGGWALEAAPAMYPVQEGVWEVEVEVPTPTEDEIAYKYVLKDEDNDAVFWEWGENRLLEVPSPVPAVMDMRDQWRPWGQQESTWFSHAFTKVLQGPSATPAMPAYPQAGTLHRFQVYAPLVGKHHCLCLLGNTEALGNWDPEKAVLLNGDTYPLWKTDVLLDGQRTGPVAYKYALYELKKRRLLAWEAGENRQLLPASNARQKRLVIHTDNLFRYEQKWRGSGVAIPVFSLRSHHSWGVGEFQDLKLMVGWARKSCQKLIQILPINDTTATHTWVDSYPYAAISVIALHPLYLNPTAICRHYDIELPERFEQKRLELNQLEQVDYEAVMKLKSRVFKWLYDEVKTVWQQEEAYQRFFESNQGWLRDYAVFSCLRDRYGTPDFSQWGEFRQYDADGIRVFCQPEQPHYDDVAIHYFIQYHLHLQLADAKRYATEKRVVLKGDIPIGIYRYSVDAWVAPQLYNMQAQAGAPPDDFAASGQNWGFPTYNWEEMARDDYQWWRKRLQKMAEYFDAYRIDHILGFFRIWEIPLDAVEGLLGHFNPCLPFYPDELAYRGIEFDEIRMAWPYIREHMLQALFGELAGQVKKQFLEEPWPGHFCLKACCDSQRKVQQYLSQCEELSEEKRERLQQGLFRLVGEQLFLPDPTHQGGFNPRIAMQHTYSFQDLPQETQGRLNALYDDYFYHRHEAFWREQAMKKLPPIVYSTPMLVCGEDLGMVPACVPEVMEELCILSLRIQRMPHQGEFGLPWQAPYLSVVSPSSHDMSTLRGWWEEDRGRSQRFFNQVLGFEGGAPYFMEPWVVEAVIRQHLSAPAMWAIFPIQDLLGMDGELRWEKTHAERINVPANPRHYWRYRMHLYLEELLEAEDFNRKLGQLVRDYGRGN